MITFPYSKTKGINAPNYSSVNRRSMTILKTHCWLPIFQEDI